MTITYDEKHLRILAGIASMDEKFDLEATRAESTFYELDAEQDEITRRRLERAAHTRMLNNDDASLDEDPLMGQLSRRRVPMHQAQSGVRKPQAYLSEPPDAGSNIDYGFGTDYDELEKAHRRAQSKPIVTGYGRGAQTGRYPGYGASIAGYISEDAE